RRRGAACPSGHTPPARRSKAPGRTSTSMHAASSLTSTVPRARPNDSAQRGGKIAILPEGGKRVFVDYSSQPSPAREEREEWGAMVRRVESLLEAVGAEDRLKEGLQRRGNITGRAG